MTFTGYGLRLVPEAVMFTPMLTVCGVALLGAEYVNVYD
jgi:hypothetical protein